MCWRRFLRVERLENDRSERVEREPSELDDEELFRLREVIDRTFQAMSSCHKNPSGKDHSEVVVVGISRIELQNDRQEIGQ